MMTAIESVYAKAMATTSYPFRHAGEHVATPPKQTGRRSELPPRARGVPQAVSPGHRGQQARS
uniref:Uncharacterized protein n=1 Tax=Arundo donax TaxID=35708 RepID=A0A0A9IB75_ARUDO